MRQRDDSPDEDSEWFEFGSLRSVWPAGFRPRKLRFYADHNFPLPVVDEVRAAGLPVLTAHEDGHASHDDGAIYRRARELDRVLLTLDDDFWDDRRHRLMDGPGVILVDVPALDSGVIVDLLARFYGIFASQFSRDWWPGTKVRIRPDVTRIKLRSPTGVVEYAMRVERSRVLFKEIRV